MATREGANEVMREKLKGMEVYPVEMAAQKTWDAFHGEDVVVPVGKRAAQARFMARFFPNALRKQLRKALPVRR
jgi:hypothetical protein